MQHPDSEKNAAAELPTAYKQLSQRQNEPLDPFMPSPSALPAFKLQHMNLQSLDDAATSFNQSGESSSLLDADMPQANQMFSGNQTTRNSSAAMPYAAAAAAAPAAAAAAIAAVDEAHPRSAQIIPTDAHEATTYMHEATPAGSSTLSVDSDAQRISLTTPDLNSTGSPRQPLAISSDTVSLGTVSDDVQVQGVDHFAADGNHHSQLRETCLPESPEFIGSLRKSSTDIVPAREAVITGAQTTPNTSLVPPAALNSHTTPGLSTAASEMPNQPATPDASGADFVSTLSSSITDQQQQQQQQQQPARKDGSDAHVEVLERDAVLKPHEAAMANAEQAERRLLTGNAAAALWCRHTQTNSVGTTPLKSCSGGMASIYSIDVILG